MMVLHELDRKACAWTRTIDELTANNFRTIALKFLALGSLYSKLASKHLYHSLALGHLYSNLALMLMLWRHLYLSLLTYYYNLSLSTIVLCSWGSWRDDIICWRSERGKPTYEKCYSMLVNTFIDWNYNRKCWKVWPDIALWSNWFVWEKLCCLSCVAPRFSVVQPVTNILVT